MTKLTKKQVKTFEKVFTEGGKKYIIIAEVRHDDQCGNGHNTFSVTGEIWRATADGRKTGRDSETCGMIHEEIAKHFPALRPSLKWHLTSTDGPMHYLANTLYWIELAKKGGDDSRYASDRMKTTEGCLDAARRTAVWLEATDDELLTDDVKERLIARLDALLAEFRAAVESLGFEY